MRLVKKRVGLSVIAVLCVVVFYQENYEVPVLMYHHVSPGGEKSSVRVRLETFNRQMEFLKTHRYHVISLDELIERLKKKERIPYKTVAITFDDGNLDNFTHAFPVLKKMNFPATIFMITQNINQTNWLSEEDLRILDSSGISIGSHTKNHAFLPNLTAGEVEMELADSKKRLESILERPVTLFSYPAGGCTKALKEEVQRLGYTGAVTTNYEKAKHDPYAIHRIKITDANGNLFNFWAKVSGLYHFGKSRIATS